MQERIGVIQTRIVDSEDSIKEMMEKEKLLYYLKVVLKPICKPPKAEKWQDIKEFGKRILEDLSKTQNVGRVYDKERFLLNLIRRNPLYKIVLKLTGRNVKDEGSGIEEIGEPLNIFTREATLFGRKKLFQYMGVLETVTHMYGSHPKFNEWLKMFEEDLNRFLEKNAIYRTEFKFSLIDDYPTILMEVKVWE